MIYCIGNPRNKTALKPGRGLLDWVKLGNSGVDLAGTKGRLIDVSTSELAKHNKRNDAWMALKGLLFIIFSASIIGKFNNLNIY